MTSRERNQKTKAKNGYIGMDIGTELKEQFVAKTVVEGRSLSKVIRELVSRYVKGEIKL